MKAQGSVIQTNEKGQNIAIPANIPIKVVKQPKEPRMVNINKWKLGENTYLVTCTGKGNWCPPCNRIKPTILELMKGKEHMGSKEVNKNNRPSHMKFVPWFDIVNSNETIVDSLQSSDANTLKNFLSPYLTNFSIMSDF